jgi:hypothetical protein
MLTELAPLFEPIAARFDVQSKTIDRLRADNASLAAEVQSLRAPPPHPGWTVIPPLDPASGANAVYASASTGNDANTGLSPDTPVASLAKAVSLLRDNTGDRLLLKAGDTFRESLGAWTRSGRSPEQPLLITAYGDGPRPRIVCAGSALGILKGEVHDLALVGLHLSAAGRDPASADFDPSAPASHGVRIIRPVANLLIEDCRIELFGNNLTLTSGDAPGARLTNVRVRRCQVLDAWSASGATTGQGLYASGCDGLLIEENVFDHNGWHAAVSAAAPNIFRHNLYLSAANSNVTVRGNVIANASSHGLQVRGGGAVEDNLFLDNALHCLIAGEIGRFRRNAVLGGRDIDANTPRGFGLTLACADGRAAHNLFAHKPTTAGAALMVQRNEWTPPGAMHAAFVANTVFNWSGNGLDVTGDCELLELAGNDLQRLAAGRKVITIKSAVGRLRLAANRYDSAESNPDRWFFRGGSFVPLQRWTQDTGDTSLIRRVPYPDSTPTLPDTFLAQARARPRETWNEHATAAALSRTLRHHYQT